MDRKLMQSLAGWAITRSDQEVYRKLLDVLAEIIPTLPEPVEVEVKLPPPPDEIPLPEVTTDYHGIIQGYTPIKPTEGCRHKFDIKTQRCVHCHKSYLEIRSRKPECF